MDDKQMEIIKQLMEELQETMQPSHDDLGDRLGRPKQVEVMKLGVGGIDPDMDGDDDSDPSMDPDMDHEMDPKMSPDDDLKRRLMQLRK